MSENSKIEGLVAVSQSVEAGLARRKLIRTGLAAAPVLLGLTSQSAMATGSGNHVSMSAWSSIKAANGCMSRGGGKAGGTCKPHTHWKAVDNFPKCGGNSNVHYANTRFHSSSTKSCPPFAGSEYSGKNLREVLSLPGANALEKLARHCTAMYLNVAQNAANGPLTEQACRDIWTSCKSGGKWNPQAGGLWSSSSNQAGWGIDDCNNYFDYICGIPNVNNPPTQSCLPV